MKSIKLLPIVFFTICVLSSVKGLTAEVEDVVTWTGCGITKHAFMKEISAAYKEKTGIDIKISGGGATKGIRAVVAGTSNLGGSCRHWLMGPAGEKNSQEKDAELVLVAWDALVAIVHKDNPVNDISLEDLKKVYQGKITRWKDLGGPDKRIALITRSGKYSGVGHLFRLLVFDDPEYEFMARSFSVKSTGPLETKIEKTVNALGVDGISSARKREVKYLSINGISPTKEKIASGTYPLFRPLYIAINKNAPLKARKVLDFILSREGQSIISQQGTVNLEEGLLLEALWGVKKGRFGL